MKYTSLPSYPQPLPASSPVQRQTNGQRLTPRQMRLLIDLIWLAVIVTLLVWVRHAADTIQRPPHELSQPQPLAFNVVAERFDRVHIRMTQEEVFALLGPEQWVEFREPEFDDFERLVEAHPDRYPGKHYWAKWADPSNPRKWVAVFFAGGYVYHTLSRGIPKSRRSQLGDWLP